MPILWCMQPKKYCPEELADETNKKCFTMYIKLTVYKTKRKAVTPDLILPPRPNYDSVYTCFT